MAATDAQVLPRKNTAFRHTFLIFDVNGDPVTGAAGLDSEVSKDGAAFADATNEATEIGNGWYYLELTATEMNADTVIVVTKTSTTNAKQAGVTLYPEEAGDLRVNVVQVEGTDATDAITAAVETGVTNVAGGEPSDSGTAQGGGTNYIDLQTGASSIDGYYVGHFVELLDGPGSPAGAYVVAYDGSNRRSTVDHDWIGTAPDATTVYRVLVDSGVYAGDLSAVASQASVDTVDSVVDIILAAVGALNDVSQAEVKAQLVAVLFTDATGEPTAMPAPTAPLAEKINAEFSALSGRKTQTQTALTQYARDDLTVLWEKTVLDDGTTFEVGKAT